MSEELEKIAKTIVVNLRSIDELIKQGRKEEAKKIFKETKKLAIERKLYRGLSGLFRRAERLIEG